jgi:hypothetical protein
MNNVVATALVSIFEEFYGDLPAGEYVVDEIVNLRVKGTVVKNEDEEYRPTAHVPLLATLEFLIPHLGATREVALEKMRAAMEAALLAGVKGDTTMPKPKDVEAAKKLVEKKYLGTLPPATRTGKTLVDCTATPVLNPAQIAAELNRQVEVTVDG